MTETRKRSQDVENVSRESLDLSGVSHLLRGVGRVVCRGWRFSRREVISVCGVGETGEGRPGRQVSISQSVGEHGHALCS